MRKHRWLRLVAVASVLALALAACGGDDDDDDASGSTTSTAAPAADRGNVDGTLAIGALLPQSGDLAVIYDALHVPITMAIDEINAAGGVNGQQVALVDADDGTDARRRRRRLDTLLTPTTSTSSSAPAASSVTLRHRSTRSPATAWSSARRRTPGRSSPTLDDGGFYFRTAPPDNLQGQALARAHHRRRQDEGRDPRPERRVRQGFADSLEQALDDGGATVTATDRSYDPEPRPTYRRTSQQVADAAPDAVVVIGFNDDGGKVVKEMIAEGVGPDDGRSGTPPTACRARRSTRRSTPANPAVVEGIKGTAPARRPGRW